MHTNNQSEMDAVATRKREVSVPGDHGATFTIPRRAALTALGAGAASLAGIGAAWGGALRDDGDNNDIEQPPHPTPQMSPEEVGWDPQARRYVLPPLPYNYDDLEPHIDAQTMELHHARHHQSYVNGLNNALEHLKEIREGHRDTGEIKHWSRELAFHGSGHLLHVIFWHCMSPAGGGRPSGDIARHIDRNFGSFEKFARHFHAAANAVEGSGWGLLCLEATSGNLLVMQAEKHQDLTAWGAIPLVAVDVWEHAYYLRYQNRRSEYIDAFMNVVNWEFADRKLRGIKSALTV